MYIALLLYIGIIGLALGSFINAWVYRVYVAEFAPKKERRKLSVFKGRSQCPDCHHELKPVDLIPVISWLSLNGRCRYCRKSISVQYPLIEAITALSLIVSFIVWPEPVSGPEIARFMAWSIIMTLSIALILTDVKWMLLPNKIVYPFIVAAITFQVLSLNEPVITWLINVLLAALVVGGLFHILYIVSNGRWIGGGDVPLGYGLGIIVGNPVNGLLILFLSSILALAAFLALSVSTHYRKNIIAYGPFLIAAMIIIVLANPQLSRLMSYFIVL